MSEGFLKMIFRRFPMKKIIAVIALASSMGVAYAGEPVALTDGQMDNVSAGGTAFSFGNALALGPTFAGTTTITGATVTVLGVVPTQAGHITIDTGAANSYSAALSF